MDVLFGFIMRFLPENNKRILAACLGALIPVYQTLNALGWLSDLPPVVGSIVAALALALGIVGIKHGEIKKTQEISDAVSAAIKAFEELRKKNAPLELARVKMNAIISADHPKVELPKDI